MTTKINLYSELGRTLTFAEGDENFNNLRQGVDNALAGITGLSEGMIGKATLADLNADLAHGEGVPAIVTNDAMVENNGIYRKSGASGAGSWVKAVDRIAVIEPLAKTRTNSWIGDGVTNHAALLRLAPTDNRLIREDWQGSRSQLFSTPRTIINLYSEPLLANLVNKSATVTQGSLTDHGLSNGITFPAAAQLDYGYQNSGQAIVAGSYSASVFVRMADGTQPKVGANNDATKDFSILIGGVIVTSVAPVYEDLGGGLWRVDVLNVPITPTTQQVGVIRYATQSGKGFTVTGLQFAQAATLGRYLKTSGALATVTDYTESGGLVTTAETPLVGAVTRWAPDAFDATYAKASDISALATAAQTDGAGTIVGSVAPMIQWDGSALMAGSGDYAFQVLGFYEQMTKAVIFDTFLARVWSSGGSLDWRLWIRDDANSFDTSAVTPEASGTVETGLLNGTLSVPLGQRIEAAAGKYIHIVFRKDSQRPAIRYWSSVQSAGQHGFWLSASATWPTSLSKSNADTYGQCGFQLVLMESVPQAQRPPRLLAPAEVTAVVGDTLQVFYRGLLESLSPDPYALKAECIVGKAYPRFFELTPAAGDVGTKALTLTQQDPSGAALSSSAMNIVVVNRTSGPASAKNILCIGDSLTGGGEWVTEFQRRVCGTGGSPAGKGFGNTTFIGTQGTNPAAHEGYGGWRYQDFLGTGATAYWVTVASHDKDATDQKSRWVDANGNQWTLETIEAVQLKLLPYAHTSAMPASGTLTWVSGGTHPASITFTAAAPEPGSPFWNSATSQVDFANYCSTHGFGGIDVAFILLGWNSLPGANKPYAADHAAEVTNGKALVDEIRSAYPSAQIRLLGLQVPSPLGGLGANYGATGSLAHYYDLLRTVNGHNLALQAWAAESSYSAFTRYLALAPQFDSDWNSQWSDQPVNSRNATTERRGTNGVHPSTPGYMQIADVAFRDYLRSFCL